MVRAKPLIEFIVIAMQKVRDNPDPGMTMNLFLKPSRQLLSVLHLLKTDAGFTNLNTFCLHVLTLYAKSKI